MLIKELRLQTLKLLVLGRPGSGCTSLLKIISNERDEFLHVSGDVRYGNLGHKGAKQFRNQIVMNTEGMDIFCGKVESPCSNAA